MTNTDILRCLSIHSLQFGNKVIVRKASENEVILRSYNYDSSPGKVYLMISGIALVQIQSEFSRKDFYSIVSKNELFGIEMLLEESQRPKEIYYTVVAQTNVEYFEIERQFFLDHFFKESMVTKILLSSMITQFLFLAQSYQVTNESMTVRIANSIVELISKLELVPNEKGIIIFPKRINQEFIANYTNASVARASTVFQELEKKKIIKRRPIRIVNLEKLQKLRNAN